MPALWAWWMRGTIALLSSGSATIAPTPSAIQVWISDSCASSWEFAWLSRSWYPRALHSSFAPAISGAQMDALVSGWLKPIFRRLPVGAKDPPLLLEFVAPVREKAVGQDVIHSLTPAQTVIKIVHDQLVELLGTEQPKLIVSPKPPTVILLVGLQGSGKTTHAGKLAVHARKMGHKPLLVAADPYRPAAVTQLQTLGKQIDVPVYHEPNKKPPELSQAAV